MAKGNRFAALRALRDGQTEEALQSESEGVERESMPSDEMENDTLAPETTNPDRDEPQKQKRSSKTEAAKPAKRRPGRPPGRRSNPDYTQISAYIPLELLLEVQDELAEDRRLKRQRTARPVSDLMEELLADWLKKRKRKKSTD